MATKYLDINLSTGANNGNSEADAYRTISAAIAGIGAGDTLYIQGGNYGFNGFPSKTNVAGITYKIYPTATAQAVFGASGSDLNSGTQIYNQDSTTIDGLLDGDPMFKFIGPNGAYTTAQTVFLIRASYGVTIRGIEIDRQTYMLSEAARINGLGTNGAGIDDIIVEDCYIHHVSGDCINTIGTSYNDGRYDHFIFRRNHLFNPGDDGIQCGSNFGITCTDNIIDANNQTPLFFGHPDGIQVNPDGGCIIVARNTFKGFNQNVFVEYAVRSVYVYNNLLIGTRTGGTDRGLNVSIRASETFVGDWLISNNTFWNFNSFNAINGGIGTNPTPEVYKNNIFINCKFLTGSADQSRFDSSNIFWDLPGAQFYDSNGNPVGVPANRYKGSSTVVDPGLVDPAGGNFAIASGSSAAVGAGVDLSAYFTDDFAGETRTSWDAGAIEYGGTPVPDTTPPTPNPSTIASVTVNGTTQITVVATTATDATSPPVEYEFSIDGAPQAWQSSATYVFTGLTPGTTHAFRVRARDAELNTTTESAATNATTDAAADTTPPTPNPATVASAVAASATEITVTATTATDAQSEPVEYQHALDGGWRDWQLSPARTFISLTPQTTYAFKVRYRDASGNVGTESSETSATTSASTSTPSPLGYRSSAILTRGAF